MLSYKFNNIANKVALFNSRETKVEFYGGAVVGPFNYAINTPNNKNIVLVFWNYNTQGSVNIDISNSAPIEQFFSEMVSDESFDIKRASDYLKSADPKSLVLYYPSTDIDQRFKVSSSNNITNIIGTGREFNNILSGVNVIIIIEKNAPNVHIKISRPPINLNNACPTCPTCQTCQTCQTCPMCPTCPTPICPKCPDCKQLPYIIPDNYCDNYFDSIKNTQNGIMCNTTTFWIMITLAILVFILTIIIIWMRNQ